MLVIVQHNVLARDHLCSQAAAHRLHACVRAQLPRCALCARPPVLKGGAPYSALFMQRHTCQKTLANIEGGGAYASNVGAAAFAIMES